MDKPTRNLDLIDSLLAEFGSTDIRPDEFTVDDYWARMQVHGECNRKTAANQLSSLVKSGRIVARWVRVDGHRCAAYSEKKP